MFAGRARHGDNIFGSVLSIRVGCDYHGDIRRLTENRVDAGLERGAFAEVDRVSADANLRMRGRFVEPRAEPKPLPSSTTTMRSTPRRIKPAISPGKSGPGLYAGISTAKSECGIPACILTVAGAGCHPARRGGQLSTAAGERELLAHPQHHRAVAGHGSSELVPIRLYVRVRPKIARLSPHADVRPLYRHFGRVRATIE